ncbi:hypothetical protein [Gordonia sp. (in: high G+C Gram-positive bacteria)]|uniref:hypothetical protein n=1 Tax=Gordonia sp. (in: high G+C Gram-positive bacteria) TaxID=84139 RepID=UPI0016AB2751|nr:hypothetical protein [Gordonia sp. (in: high G+C Gram-positive bacteria)]NLG47399.1 hypothetical protein [Gordonia sp. (in: high G+C Gram-positive bacteria)]
MACSPVQSIRKILLPLALAAACTVGCADDEPTEEVPDATLSDQEFNPAPGASSDLGDGSGEGGNPSDGGSDDGDSPAGSVAP